MPCYKPMIARRTPEGVKFMRQAKNERPWALRNGKMLLPCGQCTGCRLERSRQWAMRCVHESKLHPVNCFITLTYNATYLPLSGSLQLPDFQKFMKRLRKRYAPRKIRFYACGEYGEKLKRPHYHACLFNHDFEDKKQWTVRNEIPLYTSQELSELWPYGHSSVGAVTFESAAYVARYIMKKVNGSQKEDSYGSRAQEFTVMSRRPGIGKDYYRKYRSDMYPNDLCVMRYKEMKPPKYYDSLYELEDPKAMERIKAERIEKGIKKAIDKTADRLYAAQIVKEAQISRLTRDLE